MNKSLNLSVHQLVDFLLRRGDIDNRVYNKTTMQEGSRIHAIYQSKQGPTYLSEHVLGETFFVDEFSVHLDGRADGIIIGKNLSIIDEIKSTIDDLEHFHQDQEEWHLGQAKCYALMYAHEANLNKIGIRLTYLSQNDNSKKIYNYYFSTTELEKDVTSLIKRYLNFYKFIFHRTEERNLSCKNLHFPYKDFRPNQKKLAKYAYSIAKNGGTLFVEAPTGTGKTISMLYPYVKSFALEQNEKIFYLTAKNPGKLAAFKAIEDMKEKGLKTTEILITAKDKICFNPGASCNPDECPYAKDYYSKVNEVLVNSLINNSVFTADRIIEIAKDNDLCPFEFELDLSLFCDIIICDYNYMFDPLVHMQRYFDEDCSRFIVLVDEAHNLLERGRDMYSATIDSYYIYLVKKQLKNIPLKKIKSSLNKVHKLFKEFIEFDNSEIILNSLDENMFNAISKLYFAMQDINKNHHEYVSEEFKELFFEINRFLRIYDLFSTNFVLYVTKTDSKKIKLNLYCLDPSSLLKETFEKVRSRIVFSATLSPLEYYVEMLGGNNNDPVLTLSSPFDPNNLKVIVAPTISVKYRRRDESYASVAQYIKSFISSKIGNYLVYFPSYKYLENILQYLNLDKIEIVIQKKDMNDIDKAEFLSHFVLSPNHITVGLAILGGAFSEGIDLVEDRLIGVVVVGVGIPQLCFERDAIKHYFDEKETSGYLYSYINPGINRIMQAVGRLIRSENDRGAALLIDDRYLNKTYVNLFSKTWNNYQVALNQNDIIEILNEFWKK